MAYRHSGYPGGLRRCTYSELLDKHPERAVEKAVKGMLPHNTPRPADAEEAQGLRRPGAPAPGPAADSRSRSPRSRSSASRRTFRETDREEAERHRVRDHVTTDEATESAPESFTTESSAESSPRRPPVRSSPRPGAATGRRKQAIARVRLVPGHRQVDDQRSRRSTTYFPNKVHQQLVNEPVRDARRRGPVRRHRPHPRRRHHRPGRRAAPGHRPRAQRDRRGGQPPVAQEGRLPHP